MKTLTALLTMLFFFSGCQTPTMNKTDDIKSAPKNETKQKDILQLFKYMNPVLIDSSEYVMYPLLVKNLEDTDDNIISGSFSKSGRETSKYWNIVFYNTKTNEKYLLDNDRKMLISSYSDGYSSSSWSNEPDQTLKYQAIQDYIFYSVITEDYNKNGYLDSDDPSYLFVSDKKGRGFRQISPNNFHVSDWNFVKGNKVLIQAIRNSNDDKVFTSTDEVVPFIFDLLREKMPKQVFSKAFTDSSQNLLIKHFPKEQK